MHANCMAQKRADFVLGYSTESSVPVNTFINTKASGPVIWGRCALNE